LIENDLESSEDEQDEPLSPKADDV